MSWTCPMCGFENDDEKETCVCGFHPEGEVGSAQDDDSDDIFSEIEKRASSITAEKKPSSDDKKQIKMKVKDKPSQGAEKKAASQPAIKGDEVPVKEIEGWQFTYSASEQCMYLGTPALQSFRLRLELNDLEELLDSFYDSVGIEKPAAALDLGKADVLEMISVLNNMIENKMKKLSIEFSDDDINVIKDLVNRKLQG
ncbi:MAG: hypothetical protein JSV21_08140 [Nitrospirota bacterium]|nr:MAG: hypothetical protein JSV21_08140 [Nitrospirota bacterium]